MTVPLCSLLRELGRIRVHPDCVQAVRMNRGFHLPVIQSQDSVSKGENSGIMSNNNDGPPQTSAKICFIVVYEEAGFLHQTQTETALNVDSTSEKMTPATPVKSLLRFDSSVLIAKEII